MTLDRFHAWVCGLSGWGFAGLLSGILVILPTLVGEAIRAVTR